MSTIKIVTPISPDEIMDNLDKIIPQYVIQSVNDILKQRFRGDSGVKMTVNELVTKIQTKKNISKQTILDEKYLDFEPLYRDNGWVVEFNTPSRDESYESYYFFTKNKSQ